MYAQGAPAADNRLKPTPLTTTVVSGGTSENSTFIVHGNVQRFEAEARMPFSVKTAFHGHATFEAGGDRFRVEEGGYLVLNKDRKYRVIVNAPQPISGLSFFFAQEMIDDVQSAYLGTKRQPSEFYERVFRSESTTGLLRKFHDLFPTMRRDRLWLEETTRTVLARVLAAQEETRREAAEFPAMRAATRDDLYRRMAMARDYAEATLDGDVSLEEMARVACLSPSYFLRTFKAAFGQTPHQYVTERRLDRAQRLLMGTRMTVTDVCYAVGFESLGSFSWLFSRKIGLSPEAFRRANDRSSRRNP